MKIIIISRILIFRTNANISCPTFAAAKWSAVRLCSSILRTLAWPCKSLQLLYTSSDYMFMSFIGTKDFKQCLCKFSKPTCSPDKIRSSSSVLFVLAATFEIRTMILRSNYLMMRIQCLCVMYCIVMYWRCSCWFLTPWVFSLLSRPSVDSSRQEHFCCICRNICHTIFDYMLFGLLSFSSSFF